MAEHIPEIPSDILFEEVPSYISIQDKDCKILKVNRKFRETFGNRVGDYCYAVFKQREEKCSICPMEKTYLDGQVHRSEEIVFSPEGYPINVLVNTAPLFNKDKEIVAFMEIATDISETKKLQRKLEENSEKYRTLYNTVPCYISVQNRNFKVIDANNKFRDEFGFDRDSYCYEIYKKRDSKCDVCSVEKTFKDGKVHSSEEIVISKEGQPINVLVFAAPLRDSDGNINAVMEMSTDITSIKKMQSQMATVGTMVASLAHTIKGIITGLDGGMYVVESGFKSNDDKIVKKGWEIVQRNVDKVSHLVLDMLYFAKNRTPEKQKIDLKEICEEIIELFSKKLKENNIISKLEMNETDIFIGDRKSIYTLVLTLIENGIDACVWDKSKEKYYITIKIWQVKNMIYLSIKDTGIGMTEEVKNKLFTPLYSTKGSSGSGFGLMVVKKIIDEHKGEISVKTELGKGSEFIVKLPIDSE